MADLRMNEMEGDREALEHIARALEGRLPQDNGLDGPAGDGTEALHLTAHGLTALAGAM